MTSRWDHCCKITDLAPTDLAPTDLAPTEGVF